MEGGAIAMKRYLESVGMPPMLRHRGKSRNLSPYTAEAERLSDLGLETNVLTLEISQFKLWWW